MNSVFEFLFTFPLDYTSFLLYYEVSIKFLVVRPPFIYFLFDVIIITHNKRNVNTKSDKKFLKLKYTENSEKYSEKRRYTKQ